MRIIFPIQVFQKLKAYVLNVDTEISGLGRIRKEGSKIYIEEIRIFKQEVSGGDTVLDRTELGQFFDQIVAEGGDLADWKLWWHSHGSMKSFFSTTDVSTIADFDNDMENNNYMISLVTNHAGQIRIRIDIFAPLRCTIDNLDYDVEFEQEFDDTEVKAEILQKVSKRAPITYPNSNYTGWNWRERFDMRQRLLAEGALEGEVDDILDDYDRGGYLD